MNDLNDEEFFEAFDNYPEWYGCSLERIIFHETFHVTQKVNYLIEAGFREIETIDATNEFMRKHFNEPFRRDHKTDRPKRED